MVFSSYVFVFAFLPLTMVGYFTLSKVRSAIPQRVFLVIASLVFYAWFDWKYIFLILSSILVNFFAAFAVSKAQKSGARKALFVFAVLFNVLLLGYFKYFNFFIDTVNSVFSTDFTFEKILLPLGISFFTFQQISFQLYFYRNSDKKLNFLNYTLFVSFFAQLVAGPIFHYEDFIPQIEDLNRRKFNKENFAVGIYMFVAGLFKKLVIADSISVFVDNGFSISGQIGALPAWIIMLGYAFQIYFDFSGYSDMAIGLGKMFNYNLPVNFNTPYRSLSVKDFWKRWHITLGETLSETVYFPLGGGRKGKIRKCFNLFITFLVSGIWHGAAWTFVVWGVLHGIVRVLEEIFDKAIQKIPRIIRHIATFLFVSAAFTIFRAESFTAALKVYKGLFNFTNPGFSQIVSIANDGVIGHNLITGAAEILLIFAFCFIFIIKEKSPQKRIEDFKPNMSTAVFLSLLFVASVLCMSRSAVFIYFNF